MSRLNIGDRGRLARVLPTLCCSWVIPVSTDLLINRRTSAQPARRIREVEVLVGRDGERTIHRVRMSKIWFDGEGAVAGEQIL